ncbi:MAG: choice-of-anchor Q domain-containing protein, partial [Anaerolineales bacterium]
HALLPGSPAIDTGNPAGCTDQNGNLLTTDQRGVARPQGGRCDIGAFELEATGGGGEEVTIDVKPGRFPNRIKLTRNVCRDDDNVYVAILTTPTFNARTVDVSTLQLGDPNLSGTATPYRSRVTDVDRDGDRDLVLTFSLCSIVTNGALNASSTKLVLTGRTLDGNNFTGTDSVKVVR